MSMDLEASVVQLTAKVSLVLAVAWLGYVALKKWNPRWQVWLWRVAAVGISILMVAATLPPLYDVPVMSESEVEANPHPALQFIKNRLKMSRSKSKVGEGLPKAESVAMAESRVVVPIAEQATSSFIVAAVDSSRSQIAQSGKTIGANAATAPIGLPAKIFAHQFDWYFWGVTLYFIVTSWLISRLGLGLLIAHREAAASLLAPDWVQEVARRCNGDSLRTMIPVRMTDRLKSPVLCGVFRKIILLPSEMLTSASGEQDVRGAIAHETAHATGNDLFWDLAIGLVTAIVWPIPFAWSMRSAHRVACERVSDRMAVDALGDLTAYQGLVARIALRVSGIADFGLAMARQSEVRRRLALLASCPGVPRLGRHAIAMSLLLTAAASALGVGSLAMTANAVEKEKAEVLKEEVLLNANERERQDQGLASPAPVSTPTEDIATAAPPNDQINLRDETAQPETDTNFRRKQKRPVNADSDARLRIVIPSIQSLEDDLMWLMSLSPTEDLRKQSRKLKEVVINAFTPGMDLTQPLEMDFVFRKDEISYEYRIPVSDLTGKDGLLDNIKGSGFSVKQLVKDTFYEIYEKGKNPYFLRYDGEYGWVSRRKDALPAILPDATDDMDSLLGLKLGIAFELDNEAADISFRRETFREMRRQYESLVKLRRNEKEADFQLRKVALTQQLDEAERFVVETAAMQFGWTTSSGPTSPFGRGVFSLTPLPGTDLQTSFEEIAVKPSYFANVAMHTYPLVAGKINFPLDPLRVKNLKQLCQAIRATCHSDDEATRQATKKLFDVVDATLGSGVIDGFLDAHTDDRGKKSVVCGMRTANGKNVDQIVNLLPQMDSEWQVKLNAHQHSGISIHEVIVPKTRLQSFHSLFEGETVIYVGTNDQAVWTGIGESSLTQLKAAINQSQQPAPTKVDPVFVSYQIHVAEALKAIEIAFADMTNSTARANEKPRNQSEFSAICRLAQRAMAECNPRMRGQLRRTDNKIEGFLDLNECALKFLGTMIADQVKEFVQ